MEKDWTDLEDIFRHRGVKAAARIRVKARYITRGNIDSSTPSLASQMKGKEKERTKAEASVKRVITIDSNTKGFTHSIRMTQFKKPRNTATQQQLTAL